MLVQLFALISWCYRSPSIRGLAIGASVKRFGCFVERSFFGFCDLLIILADYFLMASLTAYSGTSPLISIV